MAKLLIIQVFHTTYFTEAKCFVKYMTTRKHVNNSAAEKCSLCGQIIETYSPGKSKHPLSVKWNIWLVHQTVWFNVLQSLLNYMYTFLLSTDSHNIKISQTTYMFLVFMARVKFGGWDKIFSPLATRPIHVHCHFQNFGHRCIVLESIIKSNVGGWGKKYSLSWLRLGA